MKKWVITLSLANFTEALRELADRLKQDTKASHEEILRTELLVEEMFLRLKKGLDGGEDFSINLTPRRSWGDTELCVTARGGECNPVPELTEEMPEEAIEQEHINLAILKANRQRISYTRRNSLNQIVIKVHEMDSTKKQIVRTLTGMVLGIVGGLLMEMLLDEETQMTIIMEGIAPLRNMFLNALTMMMAPVTFFAIMAGITNISDTAMLGKLGGKMVTVSAFMQFLTGLLGLGLATFLFYGNHAYMREGIVGTEETEALTQYPPLTDLLFSIVPKNIVDPFKGENILQVMFLAIFFGIALNKMSGKAKWVDECIDFMFRFTLSVLKIIVNAIPFIVFLSMTALFANTGLESVLAFGRLFGGLAIGVLLVWGVNALTVLIFGKITPVPLTRKLIGLSPLVFTVSSSHARLVFVLKFCSERLGIDSKLTSFSIPVGVQLNKAGNCMYFSLVTLMMMRVYEIDLTLSLFITLLFSVCIMAVAKPPVPCGGIICLTYLFSVVGVPPEAISIILCVDPLAAMFNGVCNESANIATSFILARCSHQLDNAKYHAR